MLGYIFYRGILFGSIWKDTPYSPTSRLARPKPIGPSGPSDVASGATGASNPVWPSRTTSPQDRERENIPLRLLLKKQPVVEAFGSGLSHLAL